MEDLNIFGIQNWRRDPHNRDKWRRMINRHVTYCLADQDIKETTHRYKVNAEKRRAEEAAEARGGDPRKTISDHTRVRIVENVSSHKELPVM